MATYPLGQVAIISKGAYGSSMSYVPLNMVTHRGGSYLCTAPCTNIEPGVNDHWQNYWVNASVGIRSVAIANSSGTITVTITYSDGTTYSTSYSATAIGTGAVGTDQIAAGAVVAEKFGSDILPSNVGIKMGTDTPTAGTGTNQISAGQVYLKYS